MGSNTSGQITVVGANMIDLIAYVPRFLNIGETLHGTEFQMGYGGKGANQAVMAAKLGSKVVMVTKIGEDVFGGGTRENLEKYGIDTTFVLSTDKAFSGVAPIAVVPEGQNEIVIVSGANNLLTENEIDLARDQIAKSAYLVCQLEIDLALSLHALRVARSVGTPTILNPAPAVESLPQEIYNLTDIFCPNETETQILTGLKIDSVESAEVAARELLSRGVGNVLITLGEKGCLIVNSEGAVHIPADKVKVVDTTGAGDAFVGALAHFLALGLTLKSAAEKAVKVASLSVQGKGTQTSFPERSAIPAEILAI
jgi:ribokinase